MRAATKVNQETHSAINRICVDDIYGLLHDNATKRLSCIRATSPAAALTRRRSCEYLGHALRQITWLEGLLQCRPVAPFLWQAACGITGDENERNTARGQRARHRIDLGTRHVDVQYRSVERFRSGERQGRGD